MQGSVGLHHFAQRAVHTKTHAGMPLIGLNVDVAGPVARRLCEQGIEHADDWRVVRRFKQVFNGGQVLHHAGQVCITLNLAHHRGGTGFALRIGHADALHQGLGLENINRLRGKFAHHFAHARGVRRGMQTQCQRARILFQQHLVGARKRIRQGVAHGDLETLRFNRSGNGRRRQGRQSGCSIHRYRRAGNGLRILLQAAHQLVAIL